VLPIPLAGFKWPTSKGREGQGGEGRRRERKRTGKGSGKGESGGKLAYRHLFHTTSSPESTKHFKDIYTAIFLLSYY